MEFLGRILTLITVVLFKLINYLLDIPFLFYLHIYVQSYIFRPFLIGYLSQANLIKFV